MNRPDPGLALALLFLLLAACAAPAPNPVTGTTAAPPSATFAPTASPAPAASIHLQPCRLGSHAAECGTLRVYENRAARSGRMIDLRVAVMRALEAPAAPDAIFYLAGGPGSAATEDAAAGEPFPYALMRNHDIVFVDQRGTGGSNKVLIPTDQPDLSGLPPAEYDARAREWVAQALAKLDMDPRFYTTSVAMDDLDEVRQALGYDQIDLVGFSYGATAAQYYIRQHEAHVRTAFLGAGTRLDLHLPERWAQNTQRAFDKILDRCQAEAACAQAFPNVRQEFAAVMARLAAQSVRQSFVNPLDGQPMTIDYTADWFAGFIRNMIKDGRHAGALPRLVHRVYQYDDWQSVNNLAAYGVGPEWWGDLVMDRVIRCSEKWMIFDPEVTARLAEGTFLKGRDVFLANLTAESCKYMPRGETPEGLSDQPSSRVPVLTWNGELDPICPPENMAGAQTLWPNSVSVVAPYQGHGTVDMTASACYWSLMDEFIQSGSAQGLHMDCLKNLLPPSFDTRD